MISHLRRHYQQLHLRHKIILAGLFIIGSLTSLFSSLFATLLPFETSLPAMFSSLSFDTGNYSEVYFNYGGNDFAGIIFWLSGENLSAPEIVTVNSGSQTISCSGHLRGLYYNNMRGWRLWPLDPDSLSILSGQGSGYETMMLTGGFYTNCTGVSGYTPASNEIFGYIEHTRSGITMHMVAGVNYTFSTNTITSGSSFAATLLNAGGTYSGWIWDNYGGIALVSSGQAFGLCGNGILDAGETCDDGDQNDNNSCSNTCTWSLTGGLCQGFAATPTTIYTGNTISFTCSGDSITGYALTGYILTIFSGVNNPIYTTQVLTSATSYTWITGASLPVGTYTAMCTVLANNGVGPQCPTNIPLTVLGSGTCNPNFQGDITPTNIYHVGGVMYYTNTSGIVAQISASSPATYTVSGNFTTAPITGLYTGSNFLYPISTTLYLTQSNAWNYLYSTYLNGMCTYTGATKQIYLDTLAPTSSTLISPISGTGICSTGATLFTWSAAIDTGVGLSGYRYIIQHASGTTYSGLVSSGTTSVSLLAQSLLLGNYTRRVEAFDLLGTTSTSTTGIFSLTPNACGVGVYGTGIQIIGSLSSIINAELDTVYSSEIFYIRGLTGYTPISINAGALIINGTGVGTTGLISSQDTLRIELISSDTYDDTVTSLISVAGITGTFNVTTKDNSCHLSRSQKALITRVYGLLKDQYDDNDSLLNDFLATFQKILGDEVDITEDCSLQYLLDLINDDLEDQDVDTSNHIAPNCKEYTIAYHNTERAYYSPTMKNRYYFINRETLIRHIDFYNAGDCHINTYGNASWSENRNTDSIHVAPNGKIYHIQTVAGGYTSADFVGNKYFTDLTVMRTYINSKNPATDVRDHIVDRTFTPLMYIAPNGKEYRTYKTNRGYMSYKLIKVRYFSSLSELQYHIDKNNPLPR